MGKKDIMTQSDCIYIHKQVYNAYAMSIFKKQNRYVQIAFFHILSRMSTIIFTPLKSCELYNCG